MRPSRIVLRVGVVIDSWLRKLRLTDNAVFLVLRFYPSIWYTRFSIPSVEAATSQRNVIVFQVKLRFAVGLAFDPIFASIKRVL